MFNHLSVCKSVCLSVSLPLSICLYICLSVFVFLSACLFVSPSEPWTGKIIGYKQQYKIRWILEWEYLQNFASAYWNKFSKSLCLSVCLSFFLSICYNGYLCGCLFLLWNWHQRSGKASFFVSRQILTGKILVLKFPA